MIYFCIPLFICLPVICKLNSCAEAWSKEMTVLKGEDLGLFPVVNCLNFHSNYAWFRYCNDSLHEMFRYSEMKLLPVQGELFSST